MDLSALVDFAKDVRQLGSHLEVVHQLNYVTFLLDGDWS
jgi:hypothetical protein